MLHHSPLTKAEREQRAFDNYLNTEIDVGSVWYYGGEQVCLDDYYTVAQLRAIAAALETAQHTGARPD